ncbi:uncharacterized protein ARMOST_10718 [Armillaria ostoyae]|uniref:Rho termination factor-like N-terminal domain-containing protein n=1 Tax=Armillaria ostoyae TaxID=47428 RepID=A0A284RF37_ARMOS|nr:uncharacterized protein ARMOST_10718 [Armillaria ostoyae]
MSGFTSGTGTAATWGSSSSSSISIGSWTGEGGRGESIISIGDDQRRDELGRSSGSLSLDIEITSTGATRLAGLSSATAAARFPRFFVPVQRPHFHDKRLFSRSGISRNVALRMLDHSLSNNRDASHTERVKLALLPSRGSPWFLSYPVYLLLPVVHAMQVIFTEDALKKLLVAQLKAICKERHLTGVSKLTKALLIQKILDHQGKQSGQATSPAADIDASKTAPTTQNVPKQPPSQPKAPSALSRDVSVLSGPSILTQPSQPFPPSLPSSLNLSFTSQSSALSQAYRQSQKQPPKAELPRRLITQSKTPALPPNNISIPKASDAQIKNAPKVLNKSTLPPKAPSATPSLFSRDANVSRLHPDSVAAAPAKPLTKKRPAPKEADQKSKKQKLPPKPIFPSQAASSSAFSKENPISQPKVVTLTGTGKRFSPLIVKKPAPRPSKSLATTSQATNAYLDFPDFPPISLNNITLPPSMAQRRLVTRIAIILSQVYEGDLKQCVLVSRMFRYAVYLSASQRILRDFPGRRFALLLETYPQNMTNMWPYLRLRKQEVAQRRGMYEASFLSRVFEQNKAIISPRVWTSPDHEHQAMMAVRFLLTRLFFSVSVGDDSQEWMSGTVVDAQEVIKGEIWCITMQHRAVKESFYVLEATCEVVGHPPAAEQKLDALPIRADWSAYIEHRPSSTMMEHICWTNHEEYDRGISRHWLKRMRREGKMGAALEVIAGRYVFACVVGNSGRWKSSSEMAQDFSGLASGAALKINVKNQRVNLFLPAYVVYEMWSDPSD